jgi:hypothetical protein
MIVKRQRRQARFLLCVTAVEPDLLPRRLYRVLPDLSAAKQDCVRVVDESGEDYLYPASYFVTVRVPREVTRALAKAT